jgi:hypothetical protein
VLGRIGAPEEIGAGTAAAEPASAQGSGALA